MIVLLPALIYLCFHLLGWRYPALFWGTDQLHYYPWPVGIVFVLVALGLLLVSAKASWARRADQFLARHLCRLPFERGWFQALLLLGFLLLAHTFRVRQHLLGDSSMWFHNLQLSLSPTQRATITWIHPLPLAGFEHIPAFEPLDFFLHLQFFRLGQSLWGWSTQASYEWFSLLAGVAYLAVLWKLVGLLSSNLTQRLTSLALLASLGSLQLFFGYGESYTLVTLAASAYLYTALRALRGHALLWPSLCLLLAIALHALALALLPSWIYLLWKKRGQPWKQHLHTPRFYLPLSLGAALIGLVLYTYFYPGRLPWWSPDEQGKYALLSLPHLLHLLNALLLLSPFGLVWGLVWGRRGTGDPSFHLLGWALLGSGALFGMHDAFLGGRDWDLLAFPALFYTLWGLCALHRAGLSDHSWAQIRLAVLPLMALHTALWIGINAHPERAIDRLGNLLQNTNQTNHYRQWAQGYFHLVHRKDPKTAAGHFRQARAFLDAGATDYELFRFRYDQWLAFCMAKTGGYREAVALFTQAYASNRNRWDENDLSAYEQWVTSLIQLGDEASREGRRAEADSLWTAAVSRAQEALNSEPVANLYKLQGIALKELGTYPAAIAAFQQGLLHEKAPKNVFRLYIHLAEVFQLTGDLKNTEAALAEAVRINPSGEEFVQKLRKILLPSR